MVAERPTAIIFLPAASRARPALATLVAHEAAEDLIFPLALPSSRSRLEASPVISTCSR
jgi:hypothetical protein